MGIRAGLLRSGSSARSLLLLRSASATVPQHPPRNTPNGVHTAEVTGSIPVTPTQETLPNRGLAVFPEQPLSRGPVAWTMDP